MADKEFVKGMFFNLPNEGAPDYVIGEIDIRYGEFFEWLKENKDSLTTKGYLPITIKKSRAGSYYMHINDFKLGRGESRNTGWAKNEEEPPTPEDEDFPF